MIFSPSPTIFSSRSVSVPHLTHTPYRSSVSGLIFPTKPYGSFLPYRFSPNLAHTPYHSSASGLIFPTNPYGSSLLYRFSPNLTHTPYRSSASGLIPLQAL